MLSELLVTFDESLQVVSMNEGVVCERQAFFEKDALSGQSQEKSTPETQFPRAAYIYIYI